MRIANQCLLAQGQPERFALQFVGPDGSTATSVGAQLTGLQPLPSALTAHPATPHWVVLVGLPGETIAVDNAPARAVLHWLRGLRLATNQLELVTVCAGTVQVICAPEARLVCGHVTAPAVGSDTTMSATV